ncbi:MAG TPA: sigma-70 family RNA polymerase sigma factor [Thermomicrobiales bacterium]|jgi:RNA polymerase sigma-70 factor (ECF subfamily)
MSAVIETTAAVRDNVAIATITPSDDELVTLVRAGDQEAFAALVERHKRTIYNLGYRLLGNRHDADDAAQETFLRAYTRLATYAPDGRFGAWLAAICSHWCIDTMRARGRRVQTVALGRVPESDRFISQLEGPEEWALMRAGRDEVQGWLDALPPQYRTVLILRYFQDLSYIEIAEVLDEPVSTVRMRLFRGRNLLCKIVERARDEQRHPTPIARHLQIA